ncbi:MAG TPA: dihydrofolate reductase family protein [Steroidobacteraceae bacterium]|nr:dihydrofolate reductase family protein [Steroidobacteraceae bacterium]
MRELILKMSISIDGFVASSDGGAKWIFETGDAKSAEWTVKTIWDASLHIMGGRTFRDMAAYWPTSTEVYAPPMNQIPKAVFSKQGASILHGADTTAALRDALANARPEQRGALQPGADSWTQAYVATGDLKDEITKLKAQHGKPIIAHGGSSFARSLVALGVIDQYALLVHPVALGKGQPLFAGLSAPRILELVSSTTFPRGSVAQVYRPA